MSAAEQNVALVRELLELINRDGWRAAVIDRYDDFCGPGFVWVGPAVGVDSPDGGTRYEGQEGLKGFWDEIEEVFDEINYGEFELEAIGDDIVVALVTVSGTGRGSGVHLDQEMGFVYSLSNGKIVRGENFVSQEEAMSAARSLHA